MLLYPDVMHKAQSQLDEVVGRDRLPSFDDQENLPYITAIVKELLRWRPIGPLGVSANIGLSCRADDICDACYQLYPERRLRYVVFP